MIYLPGNVILALLEYIISKQIKLQISISGQSTFISYIRSVF